MAPILVRFSPLLICLCALVLSESAPRCFAQRTPDSYGLIAPWETPAPTNLNVTPAQQSLRQSGSPVGLGEPLDPITGLPLRMTSLANSNGTGLAPRIADGTPELPVPINAPPDLPGTPSTHRADTARTFPGRMHQQSTPPPGPILRPEILTPALPAPPQNPLLPPSIIDPFQHQDLHQNGGPLRFLTAVMVSSGRVCPNPIR